MGGGAEELSKDVNDCNWLIYLCGKLTVVFIVIIIHYYTYYQRCTDLLT